MSTSKIIVSLSVALFLSACSSSKTDEWFIARNGNMPTDDKIEQINKGDSQAKVLDMLGAPSSVISLDKNTWIYMSSEVKRVAFFAPEEVDRDVLTIRFDDSGKVSEISRLDKSCGNEVAVNQDETIAHGEKLGFFRKYFGGVGQYNPISNIGNSSGL